MEKREREREKEKKGVVKLRGGREREEINSLRERKKERESKEKGAVVKKQAQE